VTDRPYPFGINTDTHTSIRAEGSVNNMDIMKCKAPSIAITSKVEIYTFLDFSTVKP
jgi:hypothetical protein